ncbi:glycoside hydrolase family 3 protein [Cryptosporangium aurantiacum]|uniref:Beta-glucosidase n=1 Tax=Cryptosporangium aurantiacum TaxID=134849 RepID=A0A1M7RMP2_9ACTN|nr:glycoside hydrolase family 3 C-terminal domain-containing protein [Cryptosporangium aurantiacum]SHN47372.1 beta-glucosidase [Cryptosporangium aurantiacum]
MTDAVCEPGTPFAAEVDAVRDGKPVEDAARSLTAQLTDAELLWLLDGDESLRRGGRAMARAYNTVPIEAGRVDRLGIPGIRFTDGPRGVVVGASTAFPAAIARAAAFDVEQERGIGAVIGREGRAQGANLFAGICVNVPPFPGWGRSQESYGEDPLLAGAMGAALTDGVRPWLLTCVKHYALNSMEEARFTVDVRVDEDVLHEVYLPHFRAVVEAGADAVMSAYNAVNGVWAGESHDLLTRVLRETWGFDGFVMTDFIFGLRDPVGSVAAGQDLEMPFRQQRATALPGALRDGRLARADVERAAARLLAAQLRLAVRARRTPSSTVVASAPHRTLARDAAVRGAVLLRNQVVGDAPVLPLALGDADRIVVFGRLADAPNLGDTGSSKVRPPATVSVLDGLRERLGDRVHHATDTTSAADAAAAIVVVGLTTQDEGEAMIGIDAEAARLLGGVARRRWVAAVIARLAGLAARRSGMSGGDRRELHLHSDDVALITAVSAANPRTVVVVIGGGTIMLDPWDEHVPGILLAWYPGMEGGHAVTDVLLGDAEPGGRLPVVIPRRRADLPTVDWKARTAHYPRWFGQRKLDRDGVVAAYPFGFGLGYTTFSIDDVVLGPISGELVRATATVRNTGDRAGRHVVQLYATRTDERTSRVLIGFAPVSIVAGGTEAVMIEATLRPLRTWTGNGFGPVPTELTVEAAAYAGDPHAATASA